MNGNGVLEIPCDDASLYDAHMFEWDMELFALLSCTIKWHYIVLTAWWKSKKNLNCGGWSTRVNAMNVPTCIRYKECCFIVRISSELVESESLNIRLPQLCSFKSVYALLSSKPKKNITDSHFNSGPQFIDHMIYFFSFSFHIFVVFCFFLFHRSAV